MARFTQLVFDSRAPASLARFWAAVLDGFEIRPYDDAEIARLAGMGRTPETDPCVILDGPAFEVCFQEVAELPGVKRAVHLDISTPDRPLERDRLVSLGASIVQEFDRHTWMHDPEGDDFCITDGWPAFRDGPMRQAGSMQRVAIVGSGGAGKSTFAAALGEATGLPVVHLDCHFWHPGWVETPRDEWRERQRELFAGERWIADGNYGGTFDERFGRADTVIVVARNRLACLTSAVWRTTRSHGKAVQAEGCPERFLFAFYRWIWNYRRDARPRLDAALAQHPHLEIIELTNRRCLRQFLAGLDVS